MNKEQALSYGVREDAYRDFQEHVSRDVNKRAREVIERRKGGEAAFALAQLREAINAMLALIDDVNTLQQMLTSVNRIYSDYLYKQRKTAENNPETTRSPETGAGGVAECQ